MKKLNIKRWSVELIIVGILLIPIFFFLIWIFDNTAYTQELDFIRKCLVGISIGIMMILVWLLGQGMIISNLLREIKEMIEKKLK
jgi:hypothetical protein